MEGILPQEITGIEKQQPVESACESLFDTTVTRTCRADLPAGIINDEVINAGKNRRSGFCLAHVGPAHPGLLVGTPGD